MNQQLTEKGWGCDHLKQCHHPFPLLSKVRGDPFYPTWMLPWTPAPPTNNGQVHWPLRAHTSESLASTTDVLVPREALFQEQRLQKRFIKINTETQARKVVWLRNRNTLIHSYQTIETGKLMKFWKEITKNGFKIIQKHREHLHEISQSVHDMDENSPNRWRYWGKMKLKH